jgi:iron complex outermembrane recepter protein
MMNPGPSRRPCAALLAVCALLLLPGAGAAQGDVGRRPPADTVERLVHRPLLVRVPGQAFALGAPRPIAALSGEELTTGRAAVFLEEVVAALPGVQIQNRYNFAVGERLAVRGYGGRAQFGVRGVRVLVDGIPATVADGQTTLDHLDVATLGRVEAMRGPGASLYGNAAGGVIHFETRLPAAERIRPELYAMSGSDGLLQLRGTASGSSGEFGYLVSAARIQYDGFRRNPVADDGARYGGADRNSVNATLHLPGGPGRLRATLNWVDLAAENPGSLSQALLDEGDRQAFANNVRQGTRKDVHQTQAGLSWDGSLGQARGEAAAYGVLRSVDNPIPSDVIFVDRAGFGGRALLEAPFAIGTLPFAAGGGVELDVQRDDRQNYANVQGERGALRLDQFERVRGAGAFGYVRAAVGAPADITAGIRYDHFDFSVSDRFAAGGAPDNSGARTMDAVSPSLGLVVRPARAAELFASVSASFETPTTTELANRPDGAGGFNMGLEPTRGTTVEAGLRALLAPGVALELTAHRTALTDELVPFEVQGVAGRTFFSNAGRSRHQGFEVALAAQGFRGLSGRAAWSWLDATFLEYSRGGTVFDGNRIPGMARYTADAVVRWAPAAGFVETRAQRRGPVPVDDANSGVAPAYTLLDLRGGTRATRMGGVELAPVAGINNLLDRRYVAAVTVNAFGGRFFEPGPARSFYLGLRVAAAGSP